MCHVDLAVRAASRVLGAPLELATVRHARFHRAVKPGAELSIRLRFAAVNAEAIDVSTTHVVSSERVAETRLLLSRREPPPGA
jgi:3-hydroxymyristoyl/3-hydroxydecanoyl-(acyl carrier protein) dehydratase